MRGGTMGLLGSVLLGLWAQAAIAAPPAQAIVVGGGDAAAADALLASWPSLAGPRLRLVEGFPQRVPAGALRGYKGGAEAVVAGYCAEPKTAELLRDLIRLTWPAAELRPAAGAAPEQCPSLVALEGPPPPARTPVASGRVDDAIKGFTWDVFDAGPPTRVDGNEVYLDLRLRVLAGKTLIDELALKGEFRPTDRVGVGVVYTAELYRLGRRHFVLVREDERQDIHGSTRLLLFGFFGGRVRELLALKERQQLAVVNDDWRRLRVYATGQSPDEGDAYRLDPVAGELVLELEESQTGK